MKTIEEKNKVIAEFMGSKDKTKVLTGIADRMKSDEMWLPFHGICSVNNLHYHTDWNWLMPCVEKIKNLGICYGDEGYSFIGCINNNLLEVSLAGVHEAVCQFIEWYNEQK